MLSGFNRLSLGHASVPLHGGLVDEGDLSASSGGSGRQGAEGQSGQRLLPASSNQGPRLCHRWSL